MRPIKFRVWDKDAKKMHPVGNITFDPELEVSVLNYNSESFSVVPKYQPHLVLMQYTGLEDSEDQEIFEGDILKVTADDGFAYVAEVKYFGGDDYPAFDLASVPAPWNYDSNVLATIAQAGVETCEVVGNIYENPELLEETDET